MSFFLRDIIMVNNNATLDEFHVEGEMILFIMQSLELE